MSVFREDIGRRRALYRLAVARNDVRGAQEIAILGEEHSSEANELWIPLQDALVVGYGRPFTSNKPYGPLANRWSKFDDPGRQELHNEIIQLRNELVAHSDATQRRVVIFPPQAQPPVPGRNPSSRATLAVTHERRGPAFFSSARELCDDLLTRMHAAVENELQAFFGGIDAVNPFDLLSGEEYTNPKAAIVLSQSEMPKPTNRNDFKRS